MADTPIIDLNEHRRRLRAEAAAADGEEAWHRGESWRFDATPYDDDAIGAIETGEVVVVLDFADRRGIRMSPADALRLGAALIQQAMVNLDTFPAETPPPL